MLAVLRDSEGVGAAPGVADTVRAQKSAAAGRGSVTGRWTLSMSSRSFPCSSVWPIAVTGCGSGPIPASGVSDSRNLVLAHFP